jgi:SAM-dependent methyltransferase
VEATRETVQDLLEEGDPETVVQVAHLDEMDYPEATFDWVVAVEAEETYVSDEDDLRRLFEEGRRLLKPGGWLYVTLPGGEEGADDESTAWFSKETIEAQRSAADLAQASEPTEGEGSGRIRAIYRCVEPHTPA